MNSLLRGKKGVLGLVLAFLLLATLFIGVPVITYGDGIGEPIDGLSSISPSGTQQSSTSLETLALLITLDLLV